MNDTLNAVIAFVGFLMLFSMLVTSVQDGLKNLFKLKARGVGKILYKSL